MINPEAWLRGPVHGVPDSLQPVAHALIQAREESRDCCVTSRPSCCGRVPQDWRPLDFICSISPAWSIDCSPYARGEGLSDDQRDTLAREGFPLEPNTDLDGLLDVLDAQVERALAQLRATPPQSLNQERASRAETTSIDRARPVVPCGRAFAAPRRTNARDGPRAVVIRSLPPSRCFVSVEVHAQQDDLRIRAARVIDGTGQVLTNATVIVRGTTIRALDVASSASPDIDLGESTLLPGLIDVHAHIGWHFGANGRYEPKAATAAQDVLYAAENAYVTLMAGFTTVQSPGQPGDVDLRDAIARGVFPGPRLLTSIVQITPATGTAAELRHTVRELKRLRADVVKIIDAVGGRGRPRARDDARSMGGIV